MRKEIIKKIITDFHERVLPEIKPRLFSIPVDTKKIVVLTGVRRGGKTYHLYNLSANLVKNKTSLKNILYFNFEDERIDKNTFVLNDILDSYTELYPGLNLAQCYFLFDEIQNVNGWEKFLRRIHEQICPNIYVTGSNATMLSREISTSLRGRSISYEIYPLSFSEYLNFLDIEINLSSSKSLSYISNAFEQFLKWGGFPETIKLDEDIKIKTFQEYFNVMLFRDIIERYNVTQTAILKYFCKRIVAGSSGQFSIHKIYNEIKSQGYKISKDTLYEFQGYVEAIYLAIFVPKYFQSAVKQEFSKKKVYSIDAGLASSIDPFFSKNTGAKLENVLLLELIKSKKTVYYHSNNYECDFLIAENEAINEAIQVCTDTSNSQTLNREVRGLVSACKEYGLKRGMIITLYDEKSYEFDGMKINIMPAYKFILSL
ncbi:MAG: ATP-binding protein [Actinobacteria bacterium]|nr:ATP-binding protein [Actinomycetota bacterium]